MAVALDSAAHRSSDPAENVELRVTERVKTGRRGRPKIQINKDFLRHALTLRGPQGLAQVFKCNSRSIRRRALEYGLVNPGSPVYEDITQPDGTLIRSYSSPTRSVSTLTDFELDAQVSMILELFPSFGRRMISGALQSNGHIVPRDRINASYLRLHGPPSSFGDRRIQRRVYSVAGPNLLWHHDGQHGASSETKVHTCLIPLTQSQA